MNRSLTFRIGLAAGASLSVHLVVFAAVGPGGTTAQIAGGGAEIHFGHPPGSHASDGAKGGGPELQPASMRVPEAAAPEPEPAPSPPAPPPPARPPEPPKPVAPPKPSPIASRPETPPVEPPPKPEPDPVVVAEKPAPEAPPEPRKQPEPPPTELADADTSGRPSGDEAEMADAGDTSEGTEGPAAGDDGEIGDPNGTTTAKTDTAAGTGSGSAASGPGNAASTNYAGLVMQHLSKVRRPRAASPGSAFVSFTIGRKGELKDIRISKSSRSSRFDRDALMVVRRAAPFPPPPLGVKTSFSVEIEGE